MMFGFQNTINMNDKLHPDIEAAIQNSTINIFELNRIVDVVDVYGSVAEFEKVIGYSKMSESDKQTIDGFNKIVSNYLTITKISDNEKILE